MKHTSKSYTQLQPEERVTLASLHQQAFSVRAMAETLQRSPSTISRELGRNSRDGHYGSVAAHRRCQTRRLQARPHGKLHPSTVTFDVVRHCLGWRWSPEPLRLSLTYDRGKEMAYHRKLTEATGVAVYFCDPHSPGNEAPTRTPTAWFDSTCPKAPTSAASPRNNWMPLLMKLMVGPAKHSG